MRSEFLLKVFFGGGLFLFLYYSINFTHIKISQKFTENYFLIFGSKKSGYLVSTPDCKIFDMDQWDSTVSKYFKPIEYVKCSRNDLLTSIEFQKNVGNLLKINEDVLSLYTNNQMEIKCCYSVITRIEVDLYINTSDVDNKYSLSKCQSFEKETPLLNTTEFIYVQCSTPGEIIPQKSPPPPKIVYKNVHSAIPILPEVSKRITKQPKRLNVLLIGIDSLSRLAFKRLMPGTSRYFQENEWIELKGYNKIGDNTHPNLLGILTGRNKTDSSNRCRVFNLGHKKCDFIWDEFKEKGYVTAYGEDTPRISTFNYQASGFVKKPTDYYLRPIFRAGEDLLKIYRHSGLDICYGPVSSIDHVLNYAKNFAEAFNDYNYFGLFWMNSFSHNDNNLARAMDAPVEKFLRNLEKIRTYDNTIVAIFSDHGVRFGLMRKTFLGYYEERLPFMNIWVPKWFREEYPDKYKNLQTNQNRLTSPYDIHLTFREILQEHGKAPGCPKCASLFEEIPTSRRCQDAGIDPEWCMCSDFKELNLKDPVVVQMGKFLLRHVENTTKVLLAQNNLRESICKGRNFLSVTEGFQSIPTGRFDGKTEYVIAIEASPGPATFQAKIQVKNSKMTVLDSVSRLDSYGGTSECTNVTELKFFCHCR